MRDEAVRRGEVNTEMTPCDACDRNIQIAEQLGIIDVRYGVDFP